MTLEELAAARPFAKPAAVPPWTLGCFRRRCITYFDGSEDTETHVLWLQSYGLTADIRIPARRPDVSGQASLADVAPESLQALARADGFIAHTAWSAELMSWDAFVTFQPYTRWPEPGRLERVGSSLIEWAPSGAYVEDWRLQPGCEGLCAGLVLSHEVDANGVVHARTGGLVVAGEHVLQVIARRTALPAGRADFQLAEAGVAAVFDCSILYGRGRSGQTTVELAIDPFAVGRPFPGLTDFSLGDAPDLIVQHGSATDDWRERHWRIDTLLSDQERACATPVTPAGAEWLANEWSVLAP